MTHAQADQQIAATNLQRAAHGNVNRVRELLDSDPLLVEAMNAIDRARVDETPQGAAAHTHSRAVLQLMLNRGVKLDIFMAAALGMADQVSDFLGSEPELARAAGAHGIPLVAHAADASTAEAMIRHGVECDIFMAAQLGVISHVTTLLENRPDLINGVNSQGLSALKLAVMYRHKPLVRQLLDRGADDSGDAARSFLEGSSAPAGLGPGALFENLNLRGAVVHNVNLSHVVMENVNLGGATLFNVNLRDAIIDWATLDGLKIQGVDVLPLIQAELKRRNTA
jgi:hypothetical protein